MIKTGLCSITFRQLAAEQIIDLVKQAGLDAIEWGGDIHVPPGNIATAEQVGQMTRDAGLAVSSYGSYYKILDGQGGAQDFAPVLESAVALKTDLIRIWAGSLPPEKTDAACRRKLIGECLKAADAAAQANVRLAFEFHNNTLTQTNESAEQLLQDINHPAVCIYWQPIYWGPDMQYRLQGLHALKDSIANLHVFYWLYDSMKESWNNRVDRRPLNEGAADWKEYFSILFPSGDHYALLEFVRHDDPVQFLKDAEVLRSWVK
ncbi:MAG: TIM barrel protein [Kiritimatiellales bacterium]